MELAGGWTIGRLVECELTELDRVLEDLVARDEYEPIRDVVVTLVVRHVIIFGHGHGLQRAIIDESQHRTPERLIMAQH